MHYLRKLPLLFALIAAILIGVLGLSSSMSNKKILTIMTISMVFFFITGLYVRSTVLSIIYEVNEKKKENNELENQDEQGNPADMVNQEESENQDGQKNNQEDTSRIYEDDFEPLRVSEFIRNELRQP
ncbi:MAG TPA: hypothetical protein VFD00_06630 [Thermoclostridium sp.]|nr:hypothetical protein [Thermoclostridium sp.]